MQQKLLALVIAILGFNLFFYTTFPIFRPGSVSFLLLMVLGQVVLHVAYFRSETSLKQKVALVASILAITAAGLACFRANEVDQFLLWATSWGLSFISWYLLALIHNQFGAISELFILPFQLGFGWLYTAIKQLEYSPTFLERLKSNLTHRSVPSFITGAINPRIFRGAVIALPVVLVFTALLRNADPIFASVVTRFFSWNVGWPSWWDQVTGRLVATLVLTVLVVPAINLLIKDRFHSPFQQKVWGKFTLEAGMVVGAVAIILAIFLGIQFRYLFASVPETELHQFGIQTYSEYVRKGFSELVVVAGLLYGVVGLSLGVLRMAAQEPKYLRRLNQLVLIEGLVFILSIFRRVLLYQADHGLTRIRIYGSVFLLVLIALTVILLLRHVVKRKFFWGATEVGVVIGGLFLAVLMNTDRLIATSLKPTVNREVDYGYIAQLSADGMDGWIEAYQHSKSVIENPEYGNRTSFSDEEARQIVYATRSIWDFDNNYRTLLMQYGTAEAQAEIVGVSPTTEQSKLARFLEMNLAQKQAYNQLTEKLPYPQFRDTKDQAEALHNRLTDNQKYQVYDRSAETPLLD